MAAAVAPTLVGAVPALEGEIREHGGIVRDSVRARSFAFRGALKVQKDLVAQSVDLQGNASIGGGITTEQLRTRGVVNLGGAMLATSDMDLKGTVETGAGVSGGDLKADGRLSVGGNLTLDGNARVRGHLEVGGNLSARSFQFDGAVHVGGTVEAPVVQGRLRGPSRIGQIRSPHVRIVRAVFSSPSRANLVVDRIEAAEVELGGVDCEYVRAERVRLGPDCHVTRVDGNVVRRHSSAVVGPVAREPMLVPLSR